MVRVEINIATYLDCVKKFREKEMAILYGFGGFYFVEELHCTENQGERERYYADLKLMSNKFR